MFVYLFLLYFYTNFLPRDWRNAFELLAGDDCNFVQIGYLKYRFVEEGNTTTTESKVDDSDLNITCEIGVGDGHALVRIFPCVFNVGEGVYCVFVVHSVSGVVTSMLIKKNQFDITTVYKGILSDAYNTVESC